MCKSNLGHGGHDKHVKYLLACRKKKADIFMKMLIGLLKKKMKEGEPFLWIK